MLKKRKNKNNERKWGQKHRGRRRDMRKYEKREKLAQRNREVEKNGRGSKRNE